MSLGFRNERAKLILNNNSLPGFKYIKQGVFTLDGYAVLQLWLDSSK